MPVRPQVHYSATGAIRDRKQRGSADTPLWDCYRKLTEEADPTAWAGGTPQDECIRRMRSKGVADPEDAAREVVLKVCKHTPTELMPYHTQACTHEIATRLRRQRQETPLGDSEDVAAEDPIEGRLAASRCLQNALQHLSAREYNIVVLDAQGYGYREIAERVGVSYENARQIASRARPKIRELCPDF